jgi:glycosyltransferase involved in cell wall biosynthesis
MQHVSPTTLARRPRVAVVIPCYNYARYLRACAASALRQRGIELSVIIVDGGSTDDTADVCAEIAASDSRVSVIRQALNGGPAATFNAGVAAATADYVTLLSADDLLAPGALRHAVALMEAHPNVGLVYGAYRSFTRRAPLPPLRSQPWAWTIYGGHEWASRYAANAGLGVFGCGTVFRTAAKCQAGEFDPRISRAIDVLLHLEVARNWDIGYINGSDHCYGRTHSDSFTKAGANAKASEMAHRHRAFTIFADRYDDDAGRELLQLAESAIAVRALDAATRRRALTDPAEEHKSLAALAVDLLPEITASEKWHEYELTGSQARRRTPAVAVSTSTRRLKSAFRWTALSLVPPRLGRLPVLQRFLFSGF